MAHRIYAIRDIGGCVPFSFSVFLTLAEPQRASAVLGVSGESTKIVHR